MEDCFTAGGQIVKSEKVALDFFLPSFHLLRPLHSAALYSSCTLNLHLHLFVFSLYSLLSNSVFFSFLSLQDKVLIHPLLNLLTFHLS